MSSTGSQDLEDSKQDESTTPDSSAPATPPLTRSESAHSSLSVTPTPVEESPTPSVHLPSAYDPPRQPEALSSQPIVNQPRPRHYSIARGRSRDADEECSCIECMVCAWCCVECCRCVMLCCACGADSSNSSQA